MNQTLKYMEKQEEDLGELNEDMWKEMTKIKLVEYSEKEDLSDALWEIRNKKYESAEDFLREEEWSKVTKLLKYFKRLDHAKIEYQRR